MRDNKHLYQWTAIDECTRIRFVYAFEEHTPENSVRFLLMLRKAFLFKIQTIQTDNDLTLYSKQQKAIKDFIAKAKECVEMPKLTAQLLHTFIQRVEVYEKPTKYSRTEGNPVMIYYKYLLTPQEKARFMIGEGLPTPEELDLAKESDIPISA